ncbi:MAG TPA: MbnP family protein, partial [Ferruginibacter sp.]|nr:MbnP family protein [Ferruginibacter sp.]
CSGAQTGALDPMNDMFWTWNSGYVMAKLEGGSPASKTMARMEYHIGGYKSNDNVVKRVDLHQSTPFVINDGKETVIVIETDLAKWWGEADKISIADNPLCTTPGSLAQRIAANYVSMFSIQNISNK